MLTLDEVSALVKQVQEYPIEEVNHRVSYLENQLKNCQNELDKKEIENELTILLDFQLLHKTFTK